MRHPLAAIIGSLLVFIVAVTGAEAATTYNVAPSGTDSGSCALVSPCASVLYATSLTVPGDTILLAAGTYGPQAATIDINGSAGLPITIQGQPGAILSRPLNATAGQQWDALLNLPNNAWFTVAGLTLIGMKGRSDDIATTFAGGTGSGDDTQAELIDRNYGHPDGFLANITITNNIISHSTSGCLKLGGGNTVTNNIFTDCGRSGHTTSHGVYCAGPTTDIKNNVVNGTSGWGIHCYGATVATDTIKNNLVSNAANDGILVTGSGSVVNANTLHDNGGCAWLTAQSTFSNNVCVKNSRGLKVTDPASPIVTGNAFVNTGRSIASNGGIGTFFTVAMTVTGNVFYNASGVAQTLFDVPFNGPLPTVDYNIYYNVTAAPNGGSPNYDGGHSVTIH